MAPTISPLFLAEVTEDAQAKPAQMTTASAPPKLNKTTTTTTPVKAAQDNKVYKWEIVWRNVIAMIYLHIFTFYGLYLAIFYAQWRTIFLALFILFLAGQGITAGAHRLWAHRCYKAKLPLRIILAFCQTLAFQNHIYEWVRDHRVHHKFTDTDADPHNAKRGFFFSHVGWLLVRKHRDVFTKGACVDLSDLLEDPVVRFQKKFYPILMPAICFGLPTVIPWYCWGESIFVSWYVCAIARYTLSLNGTWLVNSAAHIYGMKPYDKTIKPTQNKFVSIVAFGEGWHNYHHVFPWDYKASELGYKYNWSTAVIDMFARIGWAYDLKAVSQELIERRVARTGDGSRPTDYQQTDENDDHHHHHHGVDGTEIWGWLDKDISREHLEYAEITNKAD